MLAGVSCFPPPPGRPTPFTEPHQRLLISPLSREHRKLSHPRPTSETCPDLRSNRDTFRLTSRAANKSHAAPRELIRKNHATLMTGRRLRVSDACARWSNNKWLRPGLGLLSYSRPGRPPCDYCLLHLHCDCGPRRFKGVTSV